MSINVQKLLDQIETRYNALDSNSTLSEIQRITELHARKDNAILTGAKQYASVGQATSPSGITDSANVGEIYFVADQELDSSGRFFFRSLGGLINMKTATDSAENLSITAAASASGGSAPVPKPVQQGTAYGYRSGGRTPSYTNVIDKYSYTSDGNATDVGDLTGPYYGRNQGASSTTDGYNFGGYYTPPGGSWSNNIEKYSFTSDGNATDQGDLTTLFGEGGGHQSVTHGYASGGTRPPAVPTSNTIDKFPFADDGNATDVGDMLYTGRFGGGNGSDTHGYTFGGQAPPDPTGYVNQINKFPFASDANATDVGDMLVYGRFYASHQQSLTAGFISGYDKRSPGTGIQNTIETFPFASDANSTDHADLNVTKQYANGNSSTTHAYSHGGQTPSVINNIEKFSTSSATNGTDVGDLTQTIYMSGGAMY